LCAERLALVLANPGRARSFAHGLGQLAKSDRLDARALARYAANPELKLRDLPDAETPTCVSCARGATSWSRCWWPSKRSKAWIVSDAERVARLAAVRERET